MANSCKSAPIAIIFVAYCALSACAIAQIDPFFAAESLPAAPPGRAACIPQNEFIVLDPAVVGRDDHNEAALGAYERISPDGRFVMRSFSGAQLGAVSLIELPPPSSAATPYAKIKTYQTPLSNEAFPVQGTWRYLVDTNGDHYQFSSILRHQLKAQPLFRGGMTGFYAAASELPGATPGRVAIRSMSWPNANDISAAQGQGALTSRTLQIDLQTQKPVLDSGPINLCANRLREDGSMYSLPMISVDGAEFAALPQNPPYDGTGRSSRTPSMRIFGFGPDGTGCESRVQFAFASGKVTFGFPPADVPASSSGKTSLSSAKASPGDTDVVIGADAAYEYRAQVYWYSRTLSRAFNLAPYSPNADWLQLASAFPGITRDGRVIYAATWRDCSATKAGDRCPTKAGYVIADPYQSNDYVNWISSSRGSARRHCITYADVRREREAFARFHGISP